MPTAPEPEPPRVVYTDEQEAALRVLGQLLANVIKRDVDAQLKQSRHPIKSV